VDQTKPPYVAVRSLHMQKIRPHIPGRNKQSRYLAFTLCFLLSLAATCIFFKPTVVHADASVQQWNATEITLTSTVTYTHPYTDVDVNATFHGPGNVTMTMPGFWDGGNTWKVRFAPPSTGTWTYTTSSSDANNSGLNNQVGTIQCTSYTGSLPIYQHGFLKPSSSNRYLTYNDDTPFYWLGDTHWSGLVSAERLNISNDARFSSQFKGMVDRRVTQGYTVYQMHTFANNSGYGNDRCNESGCPWVNNDAGQWLDLNPAFWQNVDQRIQYIIGSGLVVNLSMGTGVSLTDSSGIANHERLARYLVARYGAYPTTWLNTQEYNLNACASCWGQVAAYVYSIDPYQRANSLHNFVDNPINFHDQSWYSFVALQAGHNTLPGLNHWLDQYAATPIKPVLEDECDYENIANEPDYYTRQCAWLAQMAGSFGYTYGAQGIWWSCWTPTDTAGNCTSWGKEYAWNQAIDFPVGAQMGYMKSFFSALPWWTLAPDGNAITWSGAPTDTQQPYEKANSDRSLLVAYLPQTSTAYTGTLNGLSTSVTYTARWFDPRQGSYSTIATNFTPGSSGQWSIPAQPDATRDWVLLVQKTGGSSLTNLALNKTYSSSSNWDSSQTADKAFDGTYNTDWQGANGTFAGDWLQVDFASSTTFDTVVLTEYGNRTSGFQIQYWDGSAWQTAYTGTTIGDDSTHHQFTFAPVTGSQARIYFTGGGPFAPIIYEFEVYYQGAASAANLALNHSYSSSSNWDSSQTADKAFDGSYNSDWQGANGTFASDWLQVDFGTNTTFNEVVLTEYGNRTSGFQIQYWDGSAWQTAYTGTTIGDSSTHRQFTFAPVTGSRARIYFTGGGPFAPIIYEFEVYKH